MIIEKTTDKQRPAVLKSLDKFRPKFCLKCKSEGNFRAMFFTADSPPKTMEDDNELRMQMKEKFGLEHDEYGCFHTGRRLLILHAVCEKCDSKHVFWDY